MNPIRLDVGEFGEDVAELHSKLIKHGFEIPKAELERKFFGPATREAVRAYQKEHGLPDTGTVDIATYNALESAVATRAHSSETAQPEPPIVSSSGVTIGRSLSSGPSISELPSKVRPILNIPAADPQGNIIVHGEVRHIDGSPVSRLIVRAYDRNAGHEDLLLGQSVTDDEGHYEISYKAEVFAPFRKSRADLLVKVFGANEGELQNSEIRFGAQPLETMDFVIAAENYRGPSEYQQLIAKLTPILGDTQAVDLQENDIEYLAGKTGTDPQKIAHLVASEKLAGQTSIPAEVFYGGLRHNLPTTLPALLNQNPDSLERALESSLAENIIPASMRDRVAEFVGNVPSWKAEEVLKSASEGQASLGDLLSTVLPTPEKRRAVAEVFASHQRATEEFWKEVRERPELTEREINQVQTTLQLGTLTGDHLPLVRELQRLGQEDPALNEPRGFAKLELADWIGILSKPQANGESISLPADVPGEDVATRITNYAIRLNQFIENTFPTNVIAHRLDKDDRVDSPFKPVKADLKTFFANNPTFEFGATPIDLYLSEDRGNRLTGVALDKQEELRATLKSMQRVFKIAPRFEQINALLVDNLHSSQAITQFGRKSFVEKYSPVLGGISQAELAYAKAEQISNMALILYAKHSALFNFPQPFVVYGDVIEGTPISGPGPEPTTSVVASESEWRALFGSLDLCDCDHCKSVYGAAAYLVDILKFLKDGPTKNGKTPLKVLLERRPDIEHIELTCENTDTPVPYVDLVQEVLENSIVAPFVPFDIAPNPSWAPEDDLDKDDFSSNLRNAFANQNIALPENTAITVVEEGKHWIITDHARLYRVIKELNPLRVRVISESLQTSGTAAELSANPEHINPAAYNYLASAVYPWSLPLNRWVEEARVYLDHLGVHRYEVLETLFQGTASDALTDKDIVAEYLGLTMFERQILTGGLQVRLAMTMNLNGFSGFSGSLLIDNVMVAPGDRVLVKDQLNTADNGIYIVGRKSFPFPAGQLELVRISDEPAVPIFIRVQAGAVNHGSGWLLTKDANGAYSIAALQPWDFWGLLEHAVFLDPMDSSKLIVGWDLVLLYVNVFLQQSGLSYKEMLGLLNTHFINPLKNDGTRTLSLVSVDPQDPATCNIEKLQIKALDASILDKIHRFIRLSRKLGWTMQDLDMAITALKPIDLDDNFLMQLSHIPRLQAALNVPLVNMLAWWADIDTASYVDHMSEGQPKIKSLYEQLFINKTVINPVDEAFTQDANALSGKINEHIPAIIAALGISTADLTLLWRLLPSIPQQPVNAAINGAGIDRTHYPEPMFVLEFGTIAGADNQFTIKFQESNDDSTYNDISNSDLQGGGQPTLVDQNNDDQVIRRSYMGTKKFLRVAVTAVQGTSPTLPISAQVVLGYSKVSDELNLANLSLLYRISSLAKALKLSIRDWLTVKALTEIDPFATTEATLRFTEKVIAIRASGFSINELNYLLRHQYVESSNVAPNEQSIALLLAEIRDGFKKIADEQAFIPDPTGELTRKTLVVIKPVLQWDDADIEQAITLLDGTQIYGEQLVSTTSLTITLPPTATDKISYNAAALSWVGIMSEGERTLLLSLAADEKYREAVDKLFKSASSGQTKTVPLAKLPQLAIPDSGSSKIIYDAQAATLRFTGAMTLPEKTLLLDLGVDQAAINNLFQQPRLFLSNKMKRFLNSDDVIAFGLLLDQGSSKEDKFDYMLLRLLTYVRMFLAKNLVKQKLGEALKLDTAVIGLLLETLLKSRVDGNQPAMSDFLALLEGGLSATYFDNQDLTGTTVKRTDPTVNFSWNSGSPDPVIAVGSFSAQWIGKLQPQYSESYTFFTNTDDGVRLWVDNQLIIDKWQDQLATEHNATLALKASQLYDIKMEYYQNNSHAVAELRWSSTSTPKTIIPANQLFPNGAPELTYQSLHKIARLISAFKISEEELVYLTAHSTGQQWLDITALPLVETESSPLLFAAWERLVSLFRFRDSLAPSKIQLFSIFKQAATPTTIKIELLRGLSQCAGWNLSDLEFLDSPQGLAFSFPDAYKDERALLRLQDCFKMMKRLGASAKQLSDWGKLKQTTTEQLENARSIKSAVKAKYDDKQWLTVAKPLKDLLREKQRTALVAYLVMHPDPAKSQHWNEVDKLYEHFLIDVEMDPCMMTTRIKQAVSSVQLFIQRCLMNLEDDVSLTPEDAKEWREWRKQYRIWEANRKVFLYPENWIEPELRDDKSPFFKDLENELLQNDVTMDIAETAFLHYLEKLDKVARLEIVGMYEQKEKAANTTEKDVDIVHIFGRTFGIPHIYYYRKREKSMWSAWEKVDLDIEGDHLIPLVWNRRLYLFWPIFSEKASTPTEAEKKAGSDPKKYWEIQIAWSEYKNQNWTSKHLSSDRLSLSSIPLIDKSGFSFSGQIGGKYLNKSGYFVGHSDIVIRCFIHGTAQIGNTAKVEIHLKPSFDSEIKDSALAFIITPLFRRYFNFATQSDDTPLDTFGSYEGNLSSVPEYWNSINSIADFMKAYFSNLKWLLILRRTPGKCRILAPHQNLLFTTTSPFFFYNDEATFFVSPVRGEWEDAYYTRPPLAFQTHFHPFVDQFLKEIRSGGINNLLKLTTQTYGSGSAWFESFEPVYPIVYEIVRPRKEVDFDLRSAYGAYNWELFFHIPFLIATRLSKNQRFEEAQKWFHYIFDPTSSKSGGPERFWNVKPFYQELSSIQTLEELMKEGKTLEQQVEAWKENPFKPYVVARLRVVAYMKTVVMKYIDNLIMWGDLLFRRDTIESINEATQLYILAAQILGKRPEDIPPLARPETQTFSSLTSGQVQLNAFANAKVEIEDYVFPSASPNASTKGGTSSLDQIWLFCIPQNDKLLGYWSTVADRLFKIRHCMNIEGMMRQLPIFEPPIDPALLVRAAAAGVDISSALSDINAALPHYRFNIMLQKAIELCNDVKALGGLLLSVLEKRDAEALALLRSSHEIKLLNAVRDIKSQQIEEAKATLEGLRRSKDVISIRYEHYKQIQFMTDWEQISLALTSASLISETAATVLDLIAGGAHVTPKYTVGVSGATGSPVATVTFGGENIARGAESWALFAKDLSSILSIGASMSSTYGNYWRRWDEWKLQEKLAEGELKQLDKQITAAEIRFAIAEYDLRNHDLQVENASEAEAFMRDKYTNEELYNWMVGQISSFYFQSYQMAYDIAKRAERGYRHELGLADSNFIQFGYWDSLKKGLLAGEKLHYDLKRMDVAYLDQNKREYEITKHVSLLQLDPLSLISLKETGQCEVFLPEALFDLDYPGHYMRRIKSISLTIPCVVGPYTGVNCTLTLLKGSIRQNNRLLQTGQYARDNQSDDTRFTDQYSSIQSIVTSSGQSDSGLFEPNLRDERYMPFEGMGTISQWRLELPTDFKQFDYNTISDVVIHIRYTAREGGEMLKRAAKSELQAAVANIENAPLMRLFSAKHEFPTEWYRFLTNPDNNDVVQSFAFSKDRFPYLFQDRTITITKVDLFGVPKQAQEVSVLPNLTSPGPTGQDVVELIEGASIGQLLHKVATSVIVNQNPTSLAVNVKTNKESASWNFKVLKANTQNFRDSVEDILMVFTYTVT